MGGTYFAQAREYKAELGRFTAEDVVRGNNPLTQTLNRYVYCWNYPIDYVDLDGKSPITQQQANEIIWNYYLSELNNTINAKKAEWGQFVNAVEEGVNNTVNEIQDVANEVRDYIGIKVEETRKNLSKNNGTVSLKGSLNATALFGVYVDIGVSCDWKGNVALQWSYSVPGVNDTASVGILDAGASVGIAFTEAEDVNGLLGPSSAIGASGGYLGYGAIDVNSFEDMSDLNGDLDGFQIGAGVGIGLDIHLTETYTNEIHKYNIFDVLENFLGTEGECSE